MKKIWRKPIVLITFSLLLVLLLVSLPSLDTPFGFWRTVTISRLTQNRCEQKVVYSGGCLPFFTDIQYDSSTQECALVTGGGCDVYRPFVSMVDCQNACVPDWQPTTAMEMLQIKGRLSVPSIGETGEFKYKDFVQVHTRVGNLANRRWAFYNLYDATFIDDQDTMVALMNSSFTGGASSGGFAQTRTLLVLFRRQPDGYYQSVDEQQAFEMSPRLRDVEFKKNGTGGWYTVVMTSQSCGGPTLPPCDQQFSRDFRISDGKLNLRAEE